MNSDLIIFLIYSLLVFSVGLISAEREFFSIEFIKRSWLDLLYFLLIILISAWIIRTFWQSDHQNTVQILIFSTTAATLIYQGFVSKIFRNYLDRPIIKLQFDDSASEYFHSTLMRIYTEILVQQGNSTAVIPLIDFVPTYYTRLKVINEGVTALENTEIILERAEVQKKTELLRPFMPLNLHWAFAEETEKWKINIPPNKAFRIVDFLELTNPQVTKEYAEKLESRDVDFKRYQALTTGFRLCSVPPNSLSDIYEQGSYIFTIGIYANNSKPLYKKIIVDYDGKWDDDPNVMRTHHLKVKLID